MLKKIITLGIIVIIIILLLFYTKGTQLLHNTIINNKLNHIKHNYIDIPEIELKYIYKIQSIKNKDIYGIIMFEEYGRPDKTNSNTIIGGHSGMGFNVFFNQLHKLKLGDSIYISYENKLYEYEVFDIFEVDEKETYILDNQYEESVITLLTCKINNSKRRHIILGKLL